MKEKKAIIKTVEKEGEIEPKERKENKQETKKKIKEKKYRSRHYQIKEP